ncbi:MAG: hypothetical protein E7302_00790 [Butyrivibrio sp.]|nr:hypothetical protein [Butyrivibrio sp.]
MDKRISNEDDQKRYYDAWMKKYQEVFADITTEKAIEWDLRCAKSMREIFTSAEFLVEAKKCLETRCYSSYYFCLYYSLFHAIYACEFMDVDARIDTLDSITHSKLIKIFESAYCNGRNGIFSKDIISFFLELRYRREYYSYVTPFNNIFDFNDDIIKLEDHDKDCYQVACFHSLLVHRSYFRRGGKFEKIVNPQQYRYMEDLFERFFAKKSNEGKMMLDPAAENIRSEAIRDGFAPWYICLELDHQYDELHTYDGFYNMEYHGIEPLNAADSYSVVYSAML